MEERREATSSAFQVQDLGRVDGDELFAPRGGAGGGGGGGGEP